MTPCTHTYAIFDPDDRVCWPIGQFNTAEECITNHIAVHWPGWAKPMEVWSDNYHGYNCCKVSLEKVML